MRKPHALTRLASALALAAIIGGCAKTDQRLKLLSTGIPTDSALRVMGVEAPQRKDAYLVGGRYIEAFYFPFPGAVDSASVLDRNMSPVIVMDGKVAAWGWSQWDSIATANKIVVAPAK
jgi:hypothetical protein